MIENNYKFSPLHHHPNCYATMDGALQRGMVEYFQAEDLLGDAHCELVSYLESMTPDRCCSCHICPPCEDCVRHSYARELIKEANKAIKIESNKNNSNDEPDDIVI